MSAPKGRQRKGLTALSPEQISARQQTDPLVRERTLAQREKQRADTPGEPVVSVNIADTARFGAGEHRAESGQDADLADHRDQEGLPTSVELSDATDERDGQAPQESTGTVYKFITTAPSPGTAAERRQDLLMMRPIGPSREVRAVQPAVIELVEKVPYVSRSSDSSLLSVGVAFARFCARNNLTGDFVPDRDLNEDTIDDFIRLGTQGVAGTSVATYKSQLRRLVRPTKKRSKSARAHAKPPFGTAHANQMIDAAIRLHGTHPALGVMFRQVVQPVDWCAADGGVDPVVIVEVDPAGQGVSSLLV